jgi:uncharacterized membrane protein YgcG
MTQETVVTVEAVLTVVFGSSDSNDNSGISNSNVSREVSCSCGSSGSGGRSVN